ncbi:hypothetical protein BDA96_01G477300 [Sorghum bicolor]|uniref:Uncharacterized protein n=2 Tax=Sorghum bicolor TaxID=4558 RepID=A0A921S4Y8_SORBI|nr:hypothetical protein BDA96_01G477300 [Sorghum bicolor]OQU92966.1 hypothetical protein SORBI_3001G448350 [Sorghum bicolor]
MEGFLEAKSDGRIGRCRVQTPFPFSQEYPLRLLLWMWVAERGLGGETLAPARLPFVLQHPGPSKAWPLLQHSFLKRQKHVANEVCDGLRCWPTFNRKCLRPWHGQIRAWRSGWLAGRIDTLLAPWSGQIRAWRSGRLAGMHACAAVRSARLEQLRPCKLRPPVRAGLWWSEWLSFQNMRGLLRLDADARPPVDERRRRDPDTSAVLEKARGYVDEAANESCCDGAALPEQNLCRGDVEEQCPAAG